LVSLQAVCVSLLEHVRSREGGEIRLEHDYFWQLTKEARYHVYEPPSEATATIGQLSECWDDLQSMLDDPSSRIGYGLVWAAEILRSIGEDVLG
jgi:hypothetical protein